MERTETLEQLDDLIRQSARGSGVIAAISGATAMGKTSLLNALAERATAAGSLVLCAVGSQDERELPYGALAQLFHSIDPEFAIGEVAAERGAGTAAPPAAHRGPMAVARETHRIVADLAAGRHLVIAVDDIQHADAASLSCLQYLAQRAARLPLALVFTRGAPIDEQPPRILHDLLYRPSVRRFHLGPLSPEGVRELAADRTSRAPSDRFVADVHALSAGNPLLAQALIEEHGFAVPSTTSGGGEGALHAGPIFHQAVLACLHRLGPRAVSLARCIALLDGAASPLLLSRLSGIDAALVERLLRGLTAIGVLDGAGFRRASVKQAVLGEMPHGKATELRHRAARILHDDGAPPQAVARHLLVAGPLREDWVLPVLRDAARQALADNDVQRVIRYLELAGECASDEAQRMSVKAQYATVQWQMEPAASGQHFRALKTPIIAGMLSDADALRMAEGMLFNLDFDDALEVIDHLNIDDARPALTAGLRGTRLLMAADFPGLLDRPLRSLPDTAASATSASELRARHALTLVLQRGADEYAIALAEQVLRGGELQPAGTIKGFGAALLSLCYADRLETAAEWCERLMAELSRYEAPAWRAHLECVAALVALRRGRLAEAAQQAEAVAARLSGPKWNVTGALAVAVLVEARTAMGDHQAAARHLAAEAPPALFHTRAGLHYLYARGRHHLATGNKYMALSDFLECGKLMRLWNIDTPSLAPWRMGAAEAWLRLGDRDQATRLVEEQLALPDTGLARSRGMTLHALASVRPTAKQPAVLQDALRLLEVGGARYESAAVLADLSRAYQRLGEKAKARTTARRAWRIAKSCQAEAMCQELLPTSSPRSQATGANGRSRGESRPDHGTFAKLSDSERRVAVLAAQGYTNREIADKLFITVSTVEQHLTRVYRKMDIRNREQLLEGAHLDSSEAV